MSKDIGKIAWFDLTVPNAEKVKDFYSKVVGWQSVAVSMGDYSDYNMNIPATGDAVTGICHARGINTDIPAQWLIYITVEDVHQSVQICQEAGGEVLVPPRKLGAYGEYAVIRDPAGAISALFTPQNG
jgi:predicted enzyme related to lactoylglutathione lyase